ncbi:zinc-binding dehydrogenase [Corynebacterium sp. USCH3]|uniref:alcohol dehydrogenase catalytic domain-containing protein n=1 Tax=Corynebacterium sp. USCH3 TaxID=3024840 RepID=UPI0030AB1937
MRAAVADRPGPLDEVVTVRTVEAPAPPGPTELTLRMLATTVNPSDAVTVSGAYASRTTFPLVPGFEGVGVVEAVGAAGAGGDLVGRRVLPLGGPGCWQQRRTVDRSWCVPVPDDLGTRTACFSYINPLTASLMVAQYCAGARSVVVTAATSAIAGHLAELLTEQAGQTGQTGQTGLRPVGLVRGTPGSTAADPDRWKSLVSTADPDWRAQLRSATSGGADVVLDCIGGPVGPDLVDALAPGGTLVLYGLLSGEPLPAECFDGRRGTRVDMFRLRDTVHSHPRPGLADLFTPVFDLQRRGLLRTPVAAETGLSGLPEALRLQASRGPRHSGGGFGRGKLLIDPWA